MGSRYPSVMHTNYPDTSVSDAPSLPPLSPSSHQLETLCKHKLPTNTPRYESESHLIQPTVTESEPIRKRDDSVSSDTSLDPPIRPLSILACPRPPFLFLFFRYFTILFPSFTSAYTGSVSKCCTLYSPLLQSLSHMFRRTVYVL